MNLRSVIYIAGPYMGKHTHDHHSYFAISQNIANAHEASLTLARMGYLFFCPHTHSAHNEVIAPDIPPEYWYELDNYFLDYCDALLVLPGESRGVKAEIALANKLGIPVYTDIETLAKNVPVSVEVG